MKQQLLGRIKHYQVFLQQKLNIPDPDGEYLTSLNFDFDICVNTFLDNYESLDQLDEQAENDLLKSQLQSQSKEDQMLVDCMKLKDEDLEGLFIDLQRSKVYQGEINLGGNNITDQVEKTLVRIASLLNNGIKLTKLSFKGCSKISFLGVLELANSIKQNKFLSVIDFKDCSLTDLGVNSLIEILQYNSTVREINFGQISDKALLYLSKQLSGDHHLQHLGFQEDLAHPWKSATKEYFLERVRNNNGSSKIISVSINIQKLHEHSLFIGQLELMCVRNRQMYNLERSNEFKVKELDTEHPEYYDPDNFEQNAFKFSVKSYLSNVFESLLDESLYFLEKERQNVLRDEEIQKITNQFTNKTISEDICTADGSLLVLAKYLIGKTKK